MNPESSAKQVVVPRPPMIDGSVANSARMWNYLLGGKDNYVVDRRIGDRIARGYPQIISQARSSRAFLGQAVTMLTAEAGIRQFLDIGCGLPAVDNIHDVARRSAPGCRVVYVDRDPQVLSHIRARLRNPPGGLLNGFQADLAQPELILSLAGRFLDLQRPVALILSNVLGHLASLEQARLVVRRLLSALPSGSHLVVAERTNVVEPEATELAIELWNQAAATPWQLWTPAEIELFFDGWELLPPGVVSCPLWRPQVPAPDPIDEYCGVGRKPSGA